MENRIKALEEENELLKIRLESSKAAEIMWWKEFEKAKRKLEKFRDMMKNIVVLIDTEN